MIMAAAVAAASAGSSVLVLRLALRDLAAAGLEVSAYQ